jgi:hypothetical protein
MKRTLKWLTVIAALFLCIAVLGLFYAQPLLPSRAFSVTATLDGAPIRAELRRPPAIPGTYYLHLPDAQPRRYSWFGIAFPRQSVFSPIALYTGWRGLPYIHTDQALGVRLTSGKIEDHWNVAFTPDGVQFSNASLSITLKRNP